MTAPQPDETLVEQVRTLIRETSWDGKTDTARAVLAAVTPALEQRGYDRGWQEALRDAAEAARGMHDPPQPDCVEWADWLDARARWSQDAVHQDLVEILAALGIGDHARPYSSHEVVQREITPAIHARREGYDRAVARVEAVLVAYRLDNSRAGIGRRFADDIRAALRDTP